MTHDKACNVLGRYCWTHKEITEAGIPGWPRTGSGNEYTRYSPWASNADGGVTEAIIWANGDTHSGRGFNQGGRQCSICQLNCLYPVEPGISNHSDNYREIRIGKILEN